MDHISTYSSIYDNVFCKTFNQSCYSSVRRPCLPTATWGLLCFAPSPTQLDCSANCVTVTDSLSHIVFVLTVSHLALVKTPGNHLINASFLDYPSHSF